MKILLVDDHPFVRQGIRLTLANIAESCTVMEAGTAKEAIAAVQQQVFDIVILDINLPDQSGFDVLQLIRALDHKPPVLVLSMHPEGSLAVRAIQAGASGYLNKESAPELLMHAIRELVNGGIHVSMGLAGKLIQVINGHSVSASHESLSDREYQVMCMLAMGKSIIQIAEALNRSANTISTYRTRILQKMGFKVNAELTQYAIAHQLVHAV